MSATRKQIISHLKRFNHLQVVDVEMAVRRIFDWGEDQTLVLTELGLSRDEITHLSQSLQRDEVSTKRERGQLPHLFHTSNNTDPIFQPRDLSQSHLSSSRAQGAISINRREALNQGMTPAKRSLPSIGRALPQISDPKETQSSPVDEFTQVLLDITDRFEIFDEIAHGAMGRIDAGWDRHLGRPVAIKTLKSERAKDVVRMRFLEEAQVTGQLQHPSIITVYELGKINDDVVFVMRRVEGVSLKALISKLRKGDEKLLEQYTLSQKLQAFYQLCQAVAYAHNKGVIHRDIKPSNVMIGDFGDIVLLDWGLCKIIGEEVRSSRSSTERWQTMHGQIIGTPAYMAPEQALGMIDQISTATDVYGLGALLYHFITHSPPFSGKTKREVVRKVLHAELIAPRDRAPQHNIPETLEALCLKCLHRDSEKRYSDAGELAEEVKLLLANGLDGQLSAIEGLPNKSFYSEKLKSEAESLRAEVGEALFHLQSIQEDLASALDAVRDHTLTHDRSLMIERVEFYRGEIQSLVSQLCDTSIRLKYLLSIIDDNSSSKQSSPSESAYGSSMDSSSLLERVCSILLSMYENAVLGGNREEQARLGYWLEVLDPVQREQLRRDVGALYLHVRPSRADVQLWQCIPEGARLKKVRPKTLKSSPLLLERVPSGQYVISIGHPDCGRRVESSLKVHSGVTTRLSINLYQSDVAPPHYQYIPSGTFTSGPRLDILVSSSEIALPDYFIMSHPITCGAYLLFLKSLAKHNLSEAKKRTPRRSGDQTLLWRWSEEHKVSYSESAGWTDETPVVGVSLDDAKRYSMWLSDRDQKHYRLPTDLEWEKAARGPDGRVFPWGDIWDARFSSGPETWDHYLPPQVGLMSTDQSVYGVSDLVGGVREWTTATDQMEHQGVIRGGSFLTADESGIPLWRKSTLASNRTAIDIGFRLVHIPDPSFRIAD